MKKHLSSYHELVEQWHPTKNGEAKPEDFTHGSKRKVWWLCLVGEDHEWQAQIYNRTKELNPSGCPFCSGRKPTSKSNLLIHFPKVAAEWHPSKNGNKLPAQFTRSSHKQVWWKCRHGHEWNETINHRTSMGTNCPYCSNKRVSKTNNLGICYPELAKEWNYQKNGSLKPDQLTWGSSKKVWWQCSRGHEWKSAVKSRSGEVASGCPFCSWQTSKPEIRLFTELNGLFPDTTWRTKIGADEVDVFIPSLKIAIEFDGSYYHSGKEQKDAAKNARLNLHGFQVIRVREKPLPNIDVVDIDVPRELFSKTDLNKIVERIVKLRGIKESYLENYLARKSYQFDDSFRKHISELPSPPQERRLSKTHALMSEEWDKKKNRPLTPDNFSSGSHHMAWWVCDKQHSYQCSIDQRTRGSGCPYCSNMRVSEQNNLFVIFPYIAAQWHPGRNSKRPDQYVFGSGKIVWWLCGEGHEWEASIRARTRKHKPTGCPYCAGKYADKKNNFLSLYPDIAKQWHPSKNGLAKPENFTYASDSKVWWLCSISPDHEWETSIKHRTRSNSGCPFCSGRRPSKTNNLRDRFPNLRKEWHPKKNGDTRPEDFTYGSKKKVWWICVNKHEWNARILSRTNLGRGCPDCYRERVKKPPSRS